ncbi:ABC transporter substrate-binding protein [Mycobacteroides chelonae]|uniref:ABC transporter substrate-binding protein n=1 Tax=Mycobacteroides chelonae TaxID=1774 RepID=A0AB73M6M4_MYCCH|nr:ABC transporter substrate-binding protein [Mycobacteroides chelonae]MBF9327320.1 ABC transporter substrate-binding protein [Mycobacteroides chelonae]MBF9421497.1 ABC transporter substrate-binding protein [Mycobacteroides chelonae]MBF9436313.1 ABC transporter substrate-binding protein [Mycobacteroides chelonae]MBV6361408.1 ABC transporter substrate-binding protein [Mycobacteroides chelonae]MEC4837912.1 ABC transporter substrate-binding protein [Mycobacteroides chelonae]
MKRTALLSALLLTVVTGCSLDSGSGSANEVTVVVGYQSKTINTVTAGTLLRAQGYLEKRLAEAGSRTGTKYTVQWQDYDTGAPITAQMLAEKIDIGSMGDYPLLINGSKTQTNEKARTELVSITGYNAKGALNMVVVQPNSPITTLPELKGKKVSASVGSAGHGTLVRALRNEGLDPAKDVEVLNQQPQVGASALESGQVQALSQFVAWPGLLVFQKKAKLLYDGAELNVPTFHGVVVRRDYAKQHPEVLDAFLQAQLDATDFIHEKSLEAARLVAEGSGLPQEVVYLYNGPGGTSFDTTLKPSLIEAFKSDVPYLKSIGDFADLDIDQFVQDGPLRQAYTTRAKNYETELAAKANPLVLQPDAGADPGQAAEIWFDGKDSTQVYATAQELLKAVNAANASGQKIRAAYVSDPELGTRWFADHAWWVRDSAGLRPFTTNAGATRYISTHPGATPLDYAQALAAAS